MAASVVVLAGMIVKLALAYRGELFSRIGRAEKIAGMLKGLHESQTGSE